MRAPAASDDRSRLVLPMLGWAAGAVFFFYAWILRVAPSVMVEELMRDFSVGAAVLGHLSAAYFYGYAGMQIPIGILLDRFGPRRLMTVAAFACAAGCVLFATGETLMAATIGAYPDRCVGGVQPGRRHGDCRAVVCAGPVRVALGVGDGGRHGRRRIWPGAAAAGRRGFRLAHHDDDAGGGGCVLGVVIWATVRDKWRGKGGIGNVLSGSASCCAIAQTWLIAVTGLATSAPLLGFAGFWGVPFLEAAYGLPRTSAATLTSTLIAGWGVGAPIFGWLSDRIGRRKAPLVVGLTLQSAAFAALVYIPGLPIPAVATLCFLVGFSGATQIVCFALVKENHPAT